MGAGGGELGQFSEGNVRDAGQYGGERGQYTGRDVQSLPFPGNQPVETGSDYNNEWGGDYMDGGGVRHGLTDLRNDIALLLDSKDNNKETKQEEATSSKNRTELPTKKPQVARGKDRMSETKVSSTKRITPKKGNLKKKTKAQTESSKVDLRKILRDVEDQKQILNEHQRILNQLLEFYKSTKN